MSGIIRNRDPVPLCEIRIKKFSRSPQKRSIINQLIDNADNEWIQDNSEDSTRLRHQSEKEQQVKHLEIEAYLQLLIETDKKSTTLKDIQGKIWKEGYTTGRISSELFEDADENLKRWHKQGYRLSVYSSGSVEAQHLLYKYTNKGDIENLFSYWFDTHIGNKKEPSSYTEIASVMGCKPQNILFISDNSDECDAARSAGLGTLYSMRDGNPQQEPRNHPVIRHLEEVEKWLNPKV
jgi:enolase-phosphatase E1